MALRLRTIDLALPAALAVAAAVAMWPGAANEAPVPVRGTIADPCTAENLVFSGTADVRATVSAGGGGTYRIEVVADFAEATATGTSGEPYDLSGTAVASGEAGAPFPVTVELVGTGLLSRAGATEPYDARLRFSLTVDDGGAIAPTGAIEVLSLACRTPGE